MMLELNSSISIHMHQMNSFYWKGICFFF